MIKGEQSFSVKKKRDLKTTPIYFDTFLHI